jgi:glucans biosynthesis protein
VPATWVTPEVADVGVDASEMRVGAGQQPVQFQTARQCGARTKSGMPCRSPATKKGRCRLHGGARGSGAPPGGRNGQYRHGERTKAAIAEQRRFSALLKLLRAGLT